MNRRRLIAVGGIVLALLLTWLVDVAYVAVVSDDYRQLLAARVEREAGVLDEMTVNSKAMGAVLLAGQLNNEIRASAMQTAAHKGSGENTAWDALRVVASGVGSNHGFVANASGVITAEWDGGGRASVIGQDVGFRTYFKQAMAGTENISAAVSLSTGKRMLYVAAPVYRVRGKAEDVIGVVVVRFDIDFVDRFLGHWQQTHGVLISPGGAVLAASREDWVLQMLGAADESRKERMNATANYGGNFGATKRSRTIPDLSGNEASFDGHHYAVVRTSVDWNDPDGKWTLILLGDLSQVAPWPRRAALMGATLAIALLLLWFSLRAVRDLELRRQSARELRASEARLQSMVRNIPGVVFRCGAEAPWHMLFVSDDIETLSGFPAADFIGESPSQRLIDLVHPEDASAMVGAMKLAVEERRQYIGEVRMIDRSGQLRWVYARGLATYDEFGQALFFDGVLFDFNDRKQAEAAMLAARKIAEDAARTKSEFLANMSHEIRTPMNAIIGMSHLVMQTALDARQRNYVTKIDKAANNLLGIINDILDFSKLEAGKLSIEKTPFDLESIFENLVSLVGIRAEDKRLELLFQLPPDVPTTLVGDPLRLEQVLLNLVNNAVKFTEHGEIVVGVAVENSEIAVNGDVVTLHFSVRDSGVGMTEAQCERLFQSFSQADASTTRKYGGTGLGLAISRTLVELMGGRIWVESELGKGSVFHFSVPLIKQTAEIGQPHKGDSLTGIRALVVDDNAIAREVLTSALGNLGCVVQAVSGGDAGLAIVEQAEREGWPFSVVLMDWNMPGVDGLACIRAMAGLSLGHMPATIMVTAFGREDVLAAAEAQGVRLQQVLTKPVLPATLYKAICVALGKAAAVPAAGCVQAEPLASARLSGARLLLVEDNEMNRELATDLLEQAGISMVCAGNGQEALAILAADDDFDGVLMDCQMPVMDGYVATRAIRENPRWRELPVIAMTANAMVGDRERAIAAGMNDHIAKPLNVAGMFLTLAQWIRPKRRAGTSEVVGAASPGGEVSTVSLPVIEALDLAAGLQVSGGDRGLYRRMLERFVSGQSGMAAQFEEAVAAADLNTATRVAHTLKGNAGNIGAHAVQAAAASLERACLSQEDGDKLLSRLGRVCEVLDPLLQSLRQELPIPALVAVMGAADPAVLKQRVLRLQALLRESDAESIEVGEEISALLGDAALKEAFVPVRVALDNCDFDQAALILGDFIARLETN